MTLKTLSYDHPSGCRATLFFEPVELENGRFNGHLEIGLPEGVEGTVRFVVADSQDLYIAPYEVRPDPEGSTTGLSLRITGTEPYVVFSAETAAHPQLPDYRFDFPDITAIDLCLRFLNHGITGDLKEEIKDTYRNHRRTPFHGFIQEAKYCLPFSSYVQLIAESAAANTTVRQDFSDSRHKFIKNLICGVGSQFPICNHAQFESRIAAYNAEDELEALDRSSIIEELIRREVDHDTHIDERCHLETTFIETADRLSTGVFVNLVSEALLPELSVSTETMIFTNNFQVDAWELIDQRYNDEPVASSYAALRNQAYKTHQLEDWKQALAAVEQPESTAFYHGVADLLYWYTEFVTIPYEIKPRIYATAESLYEAADNSRMADAARFRACFSEGQHQRQEGEFDRALAEFAQAETICRQRDGPPFDALDAYIETVLTEIAQHRDNGAFMDAYEKAEDGLSTLLDGKYADVDSGDEETLLDAWKSDLQSQHQRANGQFEEALKTTNRAIAGFRGIGEEGSAQTAQTRRYQIRAILAQLKPDFDEAADHHRAAQQEAPNKQTANLHAAEAHLCTVKHHLLHNEPADARESLKNAKQEIPTVNNLGVLIDVYDDYRQGVTTSTNEIIERLDTSRQNEPEIGRHIAYHGDYVSAVILVSGAQRLKQQNIPVSILDHITRVAIKDAMSGGITREWAERTELLQVDTEAIWRQLIPSVVLTDIEYVEILSRQPHPNYAAQGMKLLAALEGYLRVIVEYYAKQAYGTEWEQEVASQNEISLGDLYQFFESDDAAQAIDAIDDIYDELDQMRYFGEDSAIIHVRNDLDHNDLNWLDESSFEELKARVFQIIRWAAVDCPIIARIDDVNVKHDISFASAKLQWHRLPRRIELSTKRTLSKDDVVYLPPDFDIESGVAQVDNNRIETCELKPKKISDTTDVGT